MRHNAMVQALDRIDRGSLMAKIGHRESETASQNEILLGRDYEVRSDSVRMSETEETPESGPPYKSIIQIQKVEKSAGFFCGQKYSIDKRITNRTIGWAGLISAVV